MSSIISFSTIIFGIFYRLIILAVAILSIYALVLLIKCMKKYLNQG